MRADVAAAERAAEVRAAARAWAEARFITPETRAAVEAAYPDDRARLTPGLRVLAFVFTVLGVIALFAFCFEMFVDSADGPGPFVLLAGVSAALAAVATEYQRGPLARADAGAEDATALLAIGFAVVAVVAAVDALELPLRLALLLVAALTVLAAARWGGAMTGLLAAWAVLVLLADLPPGRLPWIIGTAVGAVLLLAAIRSPSLSPGQRRAGWWATAVLLVALYVGFNPLSVEFGWVEQWRLALRGGVFAPTVDLRVAWAGAVLLPLILLVAGVRRRDLLLVGLGLAMLVATIATIRWYRPILPLAYALLLAGVVLGGGALWLRRWLRNGPAGERGGWTADALWSDSNRTTVIQTALRAAPMVPAATVGSAEPERGGKFAGGGASGEF
jgi:hypothetical protein